MKNDKYSQTRGGWSRVLDITCEKCAKHICYYQKDGPGPLKRMYVADLLTRNLLVKFLYILAVVMNLEYKQHTRKKIDLPIDFFRTQ